MRCVRKPYLIAYIFDQIGPTTHAQMRKYVFISQCGPMSKTKRTTKMRDDASVIGTVFIYVIFVCLKHYNFSIRFMILLSFSCLREPNNNKLVGLDVYFIYFLK